MRAADGGVLLTVDDAGPGVPPHLRTAIFEAMNDAERDRRLWFVMDELDALGAVDGLKDALAKEVPIVRATDVFNDVTQQAETGVAVMPGIAGLKFQISEIQPDTS